jgi:hypothetical protein
MNNSFLCSKVFAQTNPEISDLNNRDSTCTDFFVYSISKLTPWSTTHFDKQTVAQLVKKLPFLLNQKVEYLVHKSPLPVPLLYNMNPVHSLHPYSFSSILCVLYMLSI